MTLDEPMFGPSRKRRAAKSEQIEQKVVVTNTTITKPEKIGKTASKIWDQVVPDLEKSGVVLCEADVCLIRQYCEVVANIQETQDYLNKNGFYIGKANNNKSLRPEVKLIGILENRALKFAVRLGISPHARKALRIKNERAKEANSAKGSLSSLRGR